MVFNFSDNVVLVSHKPKQKGNFSYVRATYDVLVTHVSLLLVMVILGTPLQARQRLYTFCPATT